MDKLGKFLSKPITKVVTPDYIIVIDRRMEKVYGLIKAELKR